MGKSVLGKQPVQRRQLFPFFFGNAIGIGCSAALHTLPGVKRPGQIFFLCFQRLQGWIPLGVLLVQPGKFLLPPPDLPAQPLQIFLLQA